MLAHNRIDIKGGGALDREHPLSNRQVLSSLFALLFEKSTNWSKMFIILS